MERAVLAFDCFASRQGSEQDDKGTEQSSSTHETGSPQPEATAIFCQVPGCNTELTHGKTYCIKKRTCTLHMQAESVRLQPDDPTLWRFCQQCGKFQQLHAFDDSKRSCRARLAKRRSGTRAQLLKKGCTAKSDNSSDDAPAASAATAKAARAHGAAAAASPELDQDWAPNGPAVAAAASGGGLFAVAGGMSQYSLSAPLLSLPSGAMVGMTNTSILDTSMLMGQQSLAGDAADGPAAGREGRCGAGLQTAAGTLQAPDGDEDDGTLTDMQLLAALQDMQGGSDPCWSSIQQPAQLSSKQQQQQQQPGVPALLGAAGSCSSMTGSAAAAARAGAAASGSAAADAGGGGSDEGLLLPSSGLSMPLQKLQLGGRSGKEWGLGPDSPQSGGAWGAGASLSAAPTLSAPLPRLASCFDDADLEAGIALFQQQDEGQQQPQESPQPQDGQQPANAAAAGSDVAADTGFAFHQQQQQQASSPALPAISGGAAAASGGAAPAAAATSPARSHSNTASMAASDGGTAAAGATAATTTTSSGGGGGLMGSRLKYLIQEVQLELQKCSTNDIENLDEAELSTLLHAALALPATASSDGSKDATAARSGGAVASGVPFAPRTPAADPIQQQQQQQLMMLSQLGYQQPELQQQVGQVHALQQQVELMRQQLELVRHASLTANNNGRLGSLAAGPQLRQTSFDESSLCRAAEGGCLSPAQRSVSCTAASAASAGLLVQQQQQYLLQQQHHHQQLTMQPQLMMQQQQASSMGMLGLPAMSMAMAEQSAPLLAMSGGSGCWASSVQQEMQQIVLQQQQLALQKQQILRAQEVLRRQVSAPGAVMAAAAAAAAGPGAGGAGLGMMPVAATGAMAAPGLGVPSAALPAAHPALPQLAMLESQLKQAQTMMTCLLVQQQASS